MALKGIRVIEFMGLAPGPFCGAILSDFGASVTVIQKIEPQGFDVLTNGKRTLSVNLKSEVGLSIVRQLCRLSDVLLDTFRPGVMEKIGLGPELLMKDNPRLIYARLSGYGQSGFYKDKAGHDLNYAAMSGVLSRFKKSNEVPVPPPFISDFAGGSTMCALGIMMALYERSLSGKGQIVDSSMTESSAYIGTWLFKSQDMLWLGEPGTNVLDGGYAFYSVYKTKDNKLMAVGALELKFYKDVLRGLGLSYDDYPQDVDPKVCKDKFQEIFATKTQAEWCDIFDDLDACVTPVLDTDEVDLHKSHISRKAFYRDNGGNVVPEPAPKLSRTPAVSSSKKPLSMHGKDTVVILKELGYSNEEIQKFIELGYIYSHKKSNL